MWLRPCCGRRSEGSSAVVRGDWRPGEALGGDCRRVVGAAWFPGPGLCGRDAGHVRKTLTAARRARVTTDDSVAWCTVKVYLDHAGTMPMLPQSVAAMLPFLTEHFGNPSGTHFAARSARRALDEARDSVAHDLGCEPGEVVFTSGGTESDNLAVLGAHAAGGGEVVCSAVEHHAVLRACESVGGTAVPVDGCGRLDVGALADVLNPDVGIVSVMLANNEVGTLQPIAEVAALVRERAPGAVFHTDAVAAVGWTDVAATAGPADLVSVSAHKFGGPKGVGALVIRDGVRIEALMRGGEQERRAACGDSERGRDRRDGSRPIGRDDRPGGQSRARRAPS